MGNELVFPGRELGHLDKFSANGLLTCCVISRLQRHSTLLATFSLNDACVNSKQSSKPDGM